MPPPYRTRSRRVRPQRGSAEWPRRWGSLRHRPWIDPLRRSRAPRPRARSCLVLASSCLDPPHFATSSRRNVLTTALVLLVGDLLEPLDSLTVERLLNRDVCHRGRRRRAMPVFLVRPDRDDVARADLLDGAAPPLVPAAPERHNQRLSERVRVPVAA